MQIYSDKIFEKPLEVIETFSDFREAFKKIEKLGKKYYLIGFINYDFDYLYFEVFDKFNGMADEVNELKESGGGSGGAVVELSGESGTFTDEQYAQCILPNTTIKWLNGSGGNIIYESWRFISPTYYFKSVYIDADECINNTIEIDQISHGWKRKSTAYSGGGSTVSVTQTLTSGTKIGAITVDGKTTALYAPEGGGSGGGGGSVPADAIIDVEELPAEENAYLFQNGATVEEYLMRKVVVRIVETLPEVGELFLTSTSCNIYYQKGDDEAYCYLTPDVPPGGSFTGWAGLSSGFGWVSDFGYGGVITDESQATDTSRKYLVYKASSINTKAFYRLEIAGKTDVYSMLGGIKNVIEGNSVGWEVVDELPEEGIDVLSKPEVEVFLYFSMSDKQAYGYYSGMWLTAAVLMANFLNVPLEYVEAMMGGSFSSDDMPELDPSKIYFIYTVGEPSYSLYHYKDGWHEIGAGGAEGTLQVETLALSDLVSLVDKKPVCGSLILAHDLSFEYYNNDGDKSTLTHTINTCIPVAFRPTVKGVVAGGTYMEVRAAPGLMIILEIGITIIPSLALPSIQPIIINLNNSKACYNDTQLVTPNYLELKVINEL